MTKLLFVTQVLDKNDSVLGAYHGWVTELAKHVEHLIVICLYEGEHTLPANVRVFSLGKERGKLPAYQYAFRFLSLAWKLRDTYDAVFVHMNQEYILLAGVIWKLLSKRVYLWRNHYAGSFLTDIAALFCTKVFCTSKYSYTAKYAKTVFMPVGVDVARFAEVTSVERIPRSILFFARIAPSKRQDMFIEALALLHERGEQFQASIYGSPTQSDQTYYEGLQAQVRDLGLAERVEFHPGVPNRDAPAIYQAHEISVNCSPSGMFDKTLFEAAASGCLVLASSEDFRDVAGDCAYFTSTKDLSRKLKEALNLPNDEKTQRVALLKHISSQNSLSSLCVLLSKNTGPLA